MEIQSWGYNWGCSESTVKRQAKEINDFNFLTRELEFNEALHWRREVLAEVIIEMMKEKGFKPKQLVQTYLGMVGEVLLDKLYSVFNKRTIESMLHKNEIITESHSRLRTDDMEMVYWTNARLAHPLDKALQE